MSWSQSAKKFSLTLTGGRQAALYIFFVVQRRPAPPQISPLDGTARAERTCAIIPLSKWSLGLTMYEWKEA